MLCHSVRVLSCFGFLFLGRQANYGGFLLRARRTIWLKFQDKWRKTMSDDLKFSLKALTFIKTSFRYHFRSFIACIIKNSTQILFSMWMNTLTSWLIIKTNWSLIKKLNQQKSCQILSQTKLKSWLKEVFQWWNQILW